jgi:Rrf2 family iron-sulfur cluster assembly transcriptional regulator
MRALVELALAVGHGPVSAALISKRQELSVAYLEQLLHRLKKEGLVSSVRGPRGGYVLAKQPHHITMAHVVRVLDGTNGHRPGSNSRRSSGAAAKETQRYAQQIAHAVRRCVHERITQSLDAVTLKDLCDEVRALAGEPMDHRYVFHI